MKKMFRAKAPLRLGLAGGGTDVSPYCDQHGGLVLNATVNLYAHSIIMPLASGEGIYFDATDIGRAFRSRPSAELVVDGQLPLHAAVYNRLVRQFNGGVPLSHRLITFSDAAPGSGLGTSSTMVVCMLQAYSEWLGLGLGEHELATMAWEIERSELGLAGGKQDQFAAAFGGFNAIEFGPGPERVVVNPLRVKDWVVDELEVSTVLFFTGTSRDSASIIKRQQVATKNQQTTLMALHELKQHASEIKEFLLRGDLNSYAAILDESWAAKKKLADGVTTTNLDRVYSYAKENGALAGKVSGAGGGGFFMFFVTPDRRMGLLDALKNIDGDVVNFHFCDRGAYSWQVPYQY
jgi:D-glycero-alpha-D-manno-heptose-7-phosphate kinase